MGLGDLLRRYFDLEMRCYELILWDLKIGNRRAYSAGLKHRIFFIWFRPNEKIVGSTDCNLS